MVLLGNMNGMNIFGNEWWGDLNGGEKCVGLFGLLFVFIWIIGFDIIVERKLVFWRYLE